MNPYLLLILFGLNLSLFAQEKTNAIVQQNFTTEEVSFKNAGVNLSGTIFKPRHITAALVIVHGSGQESRSLETATLFAKNGIAVLTYDKRGVGKSAGLYAGPEVGTNNIDAGNLNLLSADASAAVNTLLAKLPAGHVPMGLLGFSQAGWIIPLTAKLNPRVNFMVIFSGPVVTALQQLRFQFYTESKPNFWDTHTEAQAREHIKNDPDRYEFADTDPLGALSTLSIKGVWFFGGKDVQIPVNLSIEHLDALKAKGKHYTYQLFPELAHNTAYSYSEGPMPIAIQWINSLK